jgi:hypothetical protein
MAKDIACFEERDRANPPPKHAADSARRATDAAFRAGAGR